jgi:Peptidase family S41
VTISRILLVLAMASTAVAAGNEPAPNPKATTPSVSPATAVTTPAASVSPATNRSPNREEIVNSLTPADVQTALALVKKNFTIPDAVDDNEINRATLQGLLARLSKGLVLLPAKGPANTESSAPLYAEVMEGHIGYLRPGAITSPNLQSLDKRLADFAQKKVDALVLDFRASDSGDFNSGAEFAKRFVSKGKTLFSLRKQDKQDHAFVSDRDPSYNGLIVVLADVDTSGPAEAVVDALRTHDKALVIGERTAGGGVDYSELPLPSGKILRVAVAQGIGADGRRLYPEGIIPDLPVEMSLVDKRQIFRLSASKGMGQFTREAERPHLNEAALIAGTNPELETSEQRRSRVLANALVDSVLQRGMDLITSLEIYQKR